MMNVSSLMALEALQPYLPYIIGGVGAIVLLIAILVGVAKGFRRIGWGGLIWGGACALYAGANYLLSKNNPIALMAQKMGASANMANFISAVVVAVACVLVFLIVFGIVALFARPLEDDEYGYAAQNASQSQPQQPVYPPYPPYPYAPYPYPYSPYYGGEEFDEDFEEDIPAKAAKTRGSIGGVDRFFGAIVSVVNVLVVLLALAGVALVALNLTPLRGGALKPVYENQIVSKVFPFFSSYILDFLLIGIVMLYVRRGFNVGLVAGLRMLVVSLGRIAAIGLAFWLPFSPYVAEGKPLSVVGKGSNYFKSLFAKYIPEQICGALGSVAMGLVLMVVFLLIVWIVSWLLDRMIDTSKMGGAFRFLDGVLASVVYVAIGVVVCLMIGVALYGVQYFGIVETSKLFGENSVFCKGLFDFCAEFVLPYLDKVKGALGL